jgi:hypothetical protein
MVDLMDLLKAEMRVVELVALRDNSSMADLSAEWTDAKKVW